MRKKPTLHFNNICSSGELNMETTTEKISVIQKEVQLVPFWN